MRLITTACQQCRIAWIDAFRGNDNIVDRLELTEIYITADLCLWLWHSMFIATGSDAMWQGAVSICTARAVVSPPRPWGPMPRAFIFFRSSILNNSQYSKIMETKQKAEQPERPASVQGNFYEPIEIKSVKEFFFKLKRKKCINPTFNIIKIYYLCII